MQEAGVPTPKFGLAKSAAEAKKIAEDIAGNDLVSCVTEYLVMLLCLTLTGGGDLNQNNLMSDGYLSVFPPFSRENLLIWLVQLQFSLACYSLLFLLM